eukprot:3529878-Rhodomonas_salina.1
MSLRTLGKAFPSRGLREAAQQLKASRIHAGTRAGLMVAQTLTAITSFWFLIAASFRVPCWLLVFFSGRARSARCSVVLAVGCGSVRRLANAECARAGTGTPDREKAACCSACLHTVRGTTRRYFGAVDSGSLSPKASTARPKQPDSPPAPPTELENDLATVAALSVQRIRLIEIQQQLLSLYATLSTATSAWSHLSTALQQAAEAIEELCWEVHALEEERQDVCNHPDWEVTNHNSKR